MSMFPVCARSVGRQGGGGEDVQGGAAGAGEDQVLIVTILTSNFSDYRLEHFILFCPPYFVHHI